MEDVLDVRCSPESESFVKGTVSLVDGRMKVTQQEGKATPISFSFEEVKEFKRKEGAFELSIKFKDKYVELRMSDEKEFNIWFEAINEIMTEKKEIEEELLHEQKEEEELEKIKKEHSKQRKNESTVKFVDMSCYDSVTLEPKINLHPAFNLASDLAYVKNSLVKKILQETNCFNQYPISFPNVSSRDRLPAVIDPALLKFNFWKFAKQVMGMDLTKVNVPAIISEPISGLPKSVCWVQFADGFDKADTCEDPCLRLGYVLGVFLMHNGQIAHRNKKPFNPLLGETYEYVDEKKRLVVEQICHHPPINAFHFESKSAIVEGTFETQIYMTFTGPAIKLTIPREIKLKRSGDFIEVSSPNIKIHNLLFGEYYFWMHNRYEMKSSSGCTAVLEFAPKSKRAEKDFECKGHIKDAQGNIRYILKGHWNKELHAIDIDSNQEFLLGEKPSPKPGDEQHFFFDQWTLNANHLSAELVGVLPPTDSRFRTDIRAFECGNVEMTEKEKLRLEEKQRGRRKINEKLGVNWKPVWFDKTDKGKLTHRFNGKYWKHRSESKWPRQILDLFSEEPLLEL